MSVVYISGVRAGDALLERAGRLFSGRHSREIPLEEIDGMTDIKRVFTPEEAAELLQLNVQTVRRFIRDGKLDAVKIGKTYRIDRAQLESFWRSIGGVDLFSDSEAND